MVEREEVRVKEKADVAIRGGAEGPEDGGDGKEGVIE